MLNSVRSQDSSETYLNDSPKSMERFPILVTHDLRLDNHPIYQKLSFSHNCGIFAFFL